MPAGTAGRAGSRDPGQEADRGDARHRRPLLLRLPPPLQGPHHVGGHLPLRDIRPYQPRAVLQHSIFLSPHVLHQLRHQPHPIQHHVLQVINNSDFSSQNLPDVDVLICLFPDSETGSAEYSDVEKIFCSKERDPPHKVTLPLRGEE